MKNSYILSLLLVVPSLFSASQVVQKPLLKVIAPNVLELAPLSIVSSRDLSDVKIFHAEDAFFALRGGKVAKIHNYNMDAELRGLSQEAVKSFLGQGYVKLTQSSNGEYNLQLHGRLRGGGPIAGNAAYWFTKSLCWGIVGGTATVATTAVITTGVGAVGAAVGASAGAIAVTTGAATGAAGAGIGVLGGGAAGGIIASAIGGGVAASVPVTAAATTGLVTVAASGGGAVAVVAGIEAFSLFVGGLFGLAPTP